jgi:hypothetical protein
MDGTRVLAALVLVVTGFGVAGCGCTYQTSATQPATFGPNGGTGTFSVTTNKTSCKWNADEDSQAEDRVKVAGGTVTGSGSMNFTVSSQAQQPNLPLPRSGNIQIFEDGSKATAKATVKVTQTP